MEDHTCQVEDMTLCMTCSDAVVKAHSASALHADMAAYKAYTNPLSNALVIVSRVISACNCMAPNKNLHHIGKVRVVWTLASEFGTLNL